jgi:hypothetical protein
LALPPLTYVGRISYGLYLYHWPLFLALNHSHTGLLGFPLLAVRFLATFGLAALSFTFIESPIRTGTFFTGRKGLFRGGTIAVGTALLLLVATLSPTVSAVKVSNGDGIKPGEHKQLVAAHAFTTNPIRLLLVGDSEMLTLGEGLKVSSQKKFGVDVINGAVLGCDLDPGMEIFESGQATQVSTNCRHWRTVWPRVARQQHATVVALLIGRWEVFDHFYKHHWTHVGEALWDHHLEDELTEAVKSISATGAKVVLFTAPYVNPPVEAANGSTFPENLPSRVTAYNKLLRAVASREKGLVTVINLNGLVDPHGTYSSTIDHVVIRYNDGIHITLAGGEWLQPKILPEIARLGLAAKRGR